MIGWARAIVVEGLSGPHRDYLAAGGSGFFARAMDALKLRTGNRFSKCITRFQLSWPSAWSPSKGAQSPVRLQTQS